MKTYRFLSFKLVQISGGDANSIDLYCASSIRGSRVVEILERAIHYRGASPETLVVDNGPEFLCKAMERWAQDRKIRIHFIQKGRPTQNCFIESFNSILRREYLNKNWFSNVAEMAQGVLGYRDYYNQEREHSSLGWQTPAEFETNRLLPASPPALQTTTGHAIPVLG